MEEIARKIGIAIVMIIPTFVIGGALWDLFHSWFAILVWVIIMGLFTGRLVRGKFSCSRRRASDPTPHVQS